MNTLLIVLIVLFALGTPAFMRLSTGSRGSVWDDPR